MNHSTTGTSTYLLCKYSRSYPTKRTQSSQLGLEVASDWQHFTNPIIRLVLDVKKARNGEIDSVRLRILWQMNSDSGLSGDVPNQPDVVFASLPWSNRIHVLLTLPVVNNRKIWICFLFRL